MQAIFDTYGWDVTHYEQINQGLINATYEVKTSVGKEYILQSVNHHIFKQPEAIDHNIRQMGEFLKEQDPTYIFTHLVANKNGDTLCFLNGQYLRAFDKLNGISYDVLSQPNQAEEAAKAFGEFTYKLNKLPIKDVKITLPDFHNLSLRYQQFISSIQNGNSQRIAASKEAIDYLISQEHLVQQYESFIAHQDALLRVTHHDTKISNVLFDQDQHAICVIDLDTVMPGYFISDVGDMCRTYLPNVSEEESNIDLVQIDKGRWTAIRNGYLYHMNDLLTNFEKDHFEFAGSFMIYMQALRFLTDHLNNDIYYGAKYNGQNYVRAINQIALLKAYHQLF